MATRRRAWCSRAPFRSGAASLPGPTLLPYKAIVKSKQDAARQPAFFGELGHALPVHRLLPGKGGRWPRPKANSSRPPTALISNHQWPASPPLERHLQPGWRGTPTGTRQLAPLKYLSFSTPREGGGTIWIGWELRINMLCIQLASWDEPQEEIIPGKGGGTRAAHTGSPGYSTPHLLEWPKAPGGLFNSFFKKSK